MHHILPISADYIAGLPSNHASRRIDDFKENKLIKIPKYIIR